MKTVSVALVMCLNIGVDPPDVIKTTPCARLECWVGTCIFTTLILTTTAHAISHFQTPLACLHQKHSTRSVKLYKCNTNGGSQE